MSKEIGKNIIKHNLQDDTPFGAVVPLALLGLEGPNILKRKRQMSRERSSRHSRPRRANIYCETCTPSGVTVSFGVIDPSGVIAPFETSAPPEGLSLLER